MRLLGSIESLGPSGLPSVDPAFLLSLGESFGMAAGCGTIHKHLGLGPGLGDDPFGILASRLDDLIGFTTNIAEVHDHGTTDDFLSSYVLDEGHAYLRRLRPPRRHHHHDR